MHSRREYDDQERRSPRGKKTTRGERPGGNDPERHSTSGGRRISWPLMIIGTIIYFNALLTPSSNFATSQNKPEGGADTDLRATTDT